MPHVAGNVGKAFLCQLQPVVERVLPFHPCQVLLVSLEQFLSMWQYAVGERKEHVVSLLIRE